MDEIPRCPECLFYGTGQANCSGWAVKIPKCMRPESRREYKDGTRFTVCCVMRFDETLCGISGRLFRARRKKIKR